MRLTLLIPELLWSEPGDSTAYGTADPSQPARFLASRRPSLDPLRAGSSREHALLAAAGLPDDASLACLRASGDGLDSVDNAALWLCADPVHLRFHQNRLILADAAELDLQAAETDALAAAINQSLSPLQLRFAQPGHGYLRLAEPPAGALLPLSRKIGCEVRPDDFGPDAALRRIGNEIQMLFHSHPVNRAREAAGRPVVNALWLWGHGSLAPTRCNSGAPRRLFSHRVTSSLLAGIARHTGTTHATLAGPLQSPDTDTLVFSTHLSAPAQYQDAEAYALAWQELDRELLSPALDFLRRGRIGELNIVAPTVFGELRWSLTPWQARRALLLPFGQQPLSSLAARLAGDAPHARDGLAQTGLGTARRPPVSGEPVA